jgi:transposase
VSGRKRHYLVDTEGHLLLAGVGPADEDDRDGARWLLAARDGRWPDIALEWADQHSTGDLAAEAQEQDGIRLESVRKAPEQRGLVVLPRRWVVGAEHRLAGALSAVEQRLRARPGRERELVLFGLYPVAAQPLMPAPQGGTTLSPEST